MPVLNGLDSTRQIREFEALLEVAQEGRNYIVALTAHTSDEDKRDCREAGMDSFMTKPITPTVRRARGVYRAHFASTSMASVGHLRV